MFSMRCLVRGAALFGLVAFVGSAAASDNKIVLVPGGPHPYFKPWEQAAADAKRDFGIAAVDFKVPSDWKLNIQTELIESLVAQGYKGFGIFPGDAVGINSTLSELKGAGIPSIALAGCAQDPTDAEHRSKYSYFLEFAKNGRIQRHRETTPDLAQRFAGWVRDGRVDTGMKVRKLPKILDANAAITRGRGQRSGV